MASVVSVNEHGDGKLVVCCRPSTRSWAVFLAIIVSGFATALYASDCCMLKLAYIIFAFAGGAWYLDGWEDAIFDKSSNTLHLASQNFLQKYIYTNSFKRFESVKLDEISLVKVDSAMEKSNVVIVLVNASAISVCGTVGDISQIECQDIVYRIHNFLMLDLKPALASDLPSLHPAQNVPVFSSAEATVTSAVNEETASATSSEESFERVSAADLAEYDAATGDRATPLDEQLSDHASEDLPTDDLTRDVKTAAVAEPNQ